MAAQYEKQFFQNNPYALHLLNTDEDIDSVFVLIRASNDSGDCVPKLMERCGIKKSCAKKMLDITFHELGELDVERYEKRHQIMRD